VTTTNALTLAKWLKAMGAHLQAVVGWSLAHGQRQVGLPPSPRPGRGHGDGQSIAGRKLPATAPGWRGQRVYLSWRAGGGLQRLARGCPTALVDPRPGRRPEIDIPERD
jgi:hypothetical protein